MTKGYSTLGVVHRETLAPEVAGRNEATAEGCFVSIEEAARRLNIRLNTTNRGRPGIRKRGRGRGALPGGRRCKSGRRLRLEGRRVRSARPRNPLVVAAKDKKAPSPRLAAKRSSTRTSRLPVDILVPAALEGVITRERAPDQGEDRPRRPRTARPRRAPTTYCGQGHDRDSGHPRQRRRRDGFVLRVGPGPVLLFWEPDVVRNHLEKTIRRAYEDVDETARRYDPTCVRRSHPRHRTGRGGDEDPGACPLGHATSIRIV